MAKYSGGCHCGSIRYETETDLASVISCNCSICSKKGYLLTFVSEQHFNLVKGADKLSTYQFNKKNIHHMFCKNCGIGSFGKGTAKDGSTMFAINVRCLDNLDLDRLAITPVDGKSF